MDKYSFLAFFKVTGPFLSVALFAFVAYFFPWILFVLFGCLLLFAFVVIGILVKDEASQMRSDSNS